MITQIELTNYCNLKCKGCLGINSNRPYGFMTKTAFEKAIDICNQLNIKEVWLQNWGEPLLASNLLEYIKYSSKKIKTCFISNGSLLNEYMLRQLKNAGLSYIDLSINASTSLALRHHNIKLYKEANSIGVSCWIRSVVFNEEEYKDMDKLRQEENIKIRYQRGMIFDKDKKRKNDCPAIDRNFIIYWNGIIVPCCQTANNEICYGNLFDFDIIDKIKNGIKNIHNSIKINKPFEICKHCFEVDCNIPVNYKLGEK